jgi:hypothetical protein
MVTLDEKMLELLSTEVYCQVLKRFLSLTTTDAIYVHDQLKTLTPSIKKEQEETLHEQKEALVVKIDELTTIRENFLKHPFVKEVYQKSVESGAREEWIRSDVDKLKPRVEEFVTKHRVLLRECVDIKISLLRRQYDLRSQ